MEPETSLAGDPLIPPWLPTDDCRELPDPSSIEIISRDDINEGKEDQFRVGSLTQRTWNAIRAEKGALG